MTEFHECDSNPHGNRYLKRGVGEAKYDESNGGKDERHGPHCDIRSMEGFDAGIGGGHDDENTWDMNL